MCVNALRTGSRRDQRMVRYQTLQIPALNHARLSRRDQAQTMPSDQTRSAILAAAERHYADRGCGNLRLRDVPGEANVDLRAVNYHFGSKDELMAESFVARSLQLNRERLRQLHAAKDKAGGLETSRILSAPW